MVEGARHLVTGEVLAGEVLQAVGVEGGAVAKHDAGDNILRTVGARTAHDGDILDVLVGADDLLNLRRVDVEPAGDDELLDAGDELDKAVLLHHTHVAGAEPTVVEDLLGGLGVVEVAGEHLWALGKNLAGLAVGHVLVRVVRVHDADLGVREGDTDVAGATVRGLRVAHDDRRRLGQAVAFDQATAGGALPLLDDLLRQRRRSREANLDRGQVDVFLLRRLQDALEQGGHTRNECWRGFLDGLHHKRHLRGWQEHKF